MERGHVLVPFQLFNSLFSSGIIMQTFNVIPSFACLLYTFLFVWKSHSKRSKEEMCLSRFHSMFTFLMEETPGQIKLLSCLRISIIYDFPPKI